MYVWARIAEDAGQNSQDFCMRTLEKTGIWLTPGSSFGDHGEGYVRIALTLPEERLREVGRRLGRGHQ